MAIVGAFARVEADLVSSCRDELEQICGVSTFDLDDRDKVGVLVEADSLNQAHSLITESIRTASGVLGVWPVYVNTEDEEVQS